MSNSSNTSNALVSVLNTEAIDVAVDQLRPDLNPATSYIASLAEGSRRAMTGALQTVAGIILKLDPAESRDWPPDLFATVPWHKLRRQHVAHIRTILAERYKHTTANRMMAAMRGALKEAWRQGT